MFRKGGKIDKALRKIDKESSRIVTNAAEAVSNGVPAKELEHIKNRDSEQIARICSEYGTNPLSQKIALHEDSFLSFFMGKALNDLTPMLRGEISINHESAFKTMHMFLTLVDNLHGKTDLDFFIDKAEKDYHSKEAIDFAHHLVKEKPEHEDGGLALTISGYVVEEDGTLKVGEGPELQFILSLTKCTKSEKIDSQEEIEKQIAALNSHETRTAELERQNAEMEAEIAALEKQAALKARLDQLRLQAQNLEGTPPSYQDAMDPGSGSHANALGENGPSAEES